MIWDDVTWFNSTIHQCFPFCPGLGVRWGHRGGHARVSRSWETGQGERPPGCQEEQRWDILTQHEWDCLLVCLFSRNRLILCLPSFSDEDVCEYGLIRPKENQDEAEEVPDTSANISGGQRQRIHQRYTTQWCSTAVFWIISHTCPADCVSWYVCVCVCVG